MHTLHLCYTFCTRVTPELHCSLPIWIEKFFQVYYYKERCPLRSILYKNKLFLTRIPSLGACNFPIFLSRRFHRPIYFYFEFISNSVPHRNLSDQLQSQARTNVDMATWCRHVHVRLHCFILTEACSCRLELAYFAGKISKNRLVCKNAVALAY